MNTYTQRQIGDFLTPTAVAVVGASEEPGKIGWSLVTTMRENFRGKVYCVNPNCQQLFHQPCYSSVRQLPEKVSHVVIAVAQKRVLKILQDCAESGIQNVVVVSSGFKETGEAGAALERQIAELCHKNGIVLLGPNTLGFINCFADYNGTFLPQTIHSGPVSVISQSGGVGMALISSLQEMRCGLGKWVGIGNEAGLDAVDLLKFFAEDTETRAIAVCYESLRRFPEFLRLAKEVNLKKPVILLHDGNSSAGMCAAVSHTGAMAQSPEVLRQIIAQHRLLETESTRDCAVMLKALTVAPAAAGKRAAVLTNTAGPSILAVDCAEPRGVLFPQPSAALQQKIDTAAAKPLGLKNPADISSNGLNPQTYGVAAEKLLASDEFDVLLGFFSLNRNLRLPDAQLVEAKKISGKPVVACFLSTAEELNAYGCPIEQQGIPCFCDPRDAAIATVALTQWNGRQTDVTSCKSADFTKEQCAAVQVFLNSFIQKPFTLSEKDSRRLLSLIGVPVSLPQLVCDADMAVAVAAELHYPVVLKLHSTMITHKSEVGGVRLNICSEAQLRKEFLDLHSSMKKLDPEAELTIQSMAPDGFEMILGAVRTPGIGPVVMAGMGGIYAEVVRDVAFRMLPLDDAEAQSMVDSLQCSKILHGYRGPALDANAVARNLLLLAKLMEIFPEIQEIDLNPCRVYPHQMAILDARVVLNG